MAEMPKAPSARDMKWEGNQTGRNSTGGMENPPFTLSSQGIDKNLAKRAMTSKRVDADFRADTDHTFRGSDMPEVGLFLVGVGTVIILVALIGLIWSLVPR